MPLPSPLRTILLAGPAALFWLVLTAGCSDPKSDCYQDGTCECTGPQHCPEREHCVDGRCRRVTVPDLPQRGFGEPCLTDEYCASGICLPAGPGNGEVCSRACDDLECPAGWECKTHIPDDGSVTRALCVQRIGGRLCRACSVSSQCNAIGDLCLTAGGDFVCARDCTLADCPSGYTCSTVQIDGDIGLTARQCLPAGGSCECSGQTLGLTRPCSSYNEHGVCRGTQTCLQDDPLPDWGPCDAGSPVPEICNGLDDDCDGLTDAMDPSVDTSSLPDDPPWPNCRKGSGESQCIGRWHCQPDEPSGFSWVCGATDPQNEICNGLDDNCDSVADDPFIDAAGLYVRVEHCGACGIDCLVVLPELRRGEEGQVVDGAVACQVRDGRPTCVPQLCEPDFYPFPEDEPVTCARLVSPACQPCSSDADCRVSSDRCIAIGQDPGGHCAQSCEPFSPYFGCTGTVWVRSCCPEGFRCELVQGQRLCLPEAGTCTCNAERVGYTRTCLISGAADELCQGLQTCLSQQDYFAWGECEQSDVVVEVCDYQDNNCDGEVDEGFRDESGEYTTDEHCGACNVNCPARWDREIQHAIGGCVQQGPLPTCQITACTRETEDAYLPCRDDEDCRPGGHCDPTLHICQPDGPGQCPAGVCPIQCSDDDQCAGYYGPGFACDEASSTCRGDFQFHDSNDLEVDGCECAQQVDAGPDEPDMSDAYPEPGWTYVDRDCDGIDGHAASSLFVWSGTPASLGTRQAPYATVGEALAAFDPALHSAVLVAAGAYRENVVLTDGMRLYGGYSPDFSDRDVVLYPTLLLGQEPDHQDPAHRPGTVNAEGLFGRTVLSGFIVQGYDVNFDPAPGQPAPSSFAIYIKDCDSGLEIVNNWILGGRGGDGADGASGSSGTSGVDGRPGADSWECPDSTDCYGYTSPGGAGGQNQDCPGAAGRPGATARGSAFDPQDYQGGGIDGRGGYNSTYAHSDPSQADLCKYDCQVGIESSNNGDDARAGTAGPHGIGGSGCSRAGGAVVDGLWQAAAAGDGGGGTAGAGGGGGGAGGAVYNDNWYSGCTQGNPFGDLGGSGGGGGAGGCGGTGGRRSGGGGGSFGVFLAFSSQPSSLPVIRGNLIRRCFGGAGGAGGGAGQGGLSGQSGLGGGIVQPAWCAGAGGRGGRGGDGGAGGGGGGGCGGVSFGIAGQWLAQADYRSNNRFTVPGTPATGGSGGAGGPSPAGPGSGGDAGSDGAADDLGSF